MLRIHQSRNTEDNLAFITEWHVEKRNRTEISSLSTESHQTQKRRPPLLQSRVEISMFWILSFEIIFTVCLQSLISHHLDVPTEMTVLASCTDTHLKLLFYSFLFYVNGRQHFLCHSHTIEALKWTAKKKPFKLLFKTPWKKWSVQASFPYT